MRKKDLLLQNIQLFDRISVAEAQVAELKKEIAERDRIIAAQKKELESLKADVIEPEPLKVTELETVNEPKKSSSDAPDIEYGASVIGKTVVEAARYCNFITIDDNSDMAKELVNLILGRTEVAKAEILKIVYSDDEFENKKRKIQVQFGLAVDYFKSIMAQRE